VRAHVGDLRHTLKRIEPGVDLIFHDPFQPLRNSEAWTVEVFGLLADLLKPDGLLLTYSQSRIVRAGLVEAGLAVGATPAAPPHRGGTAAARAPDLLAHPLPEPEGGWGEPFRDPGLDDTPARIRSRREAATRA
jgi:tRNA U34 5-methylaminomethyl-2-thiouridine-forming methyltransferase MnmC